jgi:hypothetical protein
MDTKSNLVLFLFAASISAAAQADNCYEMPWPGTDVTHLQCDSPAQSGRNASKPSQASAAGTPSSPCPAMASAHKSTTKRGARAAATRPT